jgi:hypothetical protein
MLHVSELEARPSPCGQWHEFTSAFSGIEDVAGLAVGSMPSRMTSTATLAVRCRIGFDVDFGTIKVLDQTDTMPPLGLGERP